MYKSYNQFDRNDHTQHVQQFDRAYNYNLQISMLLTIIWSVFSINIHKADNCTANSRASDQIALRHIFITINKIVRESNKRQ